MKTATTTDEEARGQDLFAPKKLLLEAVGKEEIKRVSLSLLLGSRGRQSTAVRNTKGYRVVTGGKRPTRVWVGCNY